MARDNRQIVARIQAALDKREMSARAASLEAGLGPDAIRDLIRKPKTFPTIDTLEKLSEVIGREPEYLAFGKRASRRASNVPAVKTIGEVAAGLWHDLEGSEDREFKQHPIPFDPDYPEEAQYGLRVVGTSINKIAEPDDLLHCLDTGISGLEPQQEDLVIVERRRAGQREVTAKLFRKKGRIVELAPASTDRRWTDPVVLDPRQLSEGEEVAVIAIVIGVYSSLRRK